MPIKNQSRKKWYAGETISLGIGQGYNNFTMLQLAQATATLVNGGYKYKPKLIVATQDAVTRTKQAVAGSPPENLGFLPENVEIVKRAMVGVTQEGTSVRSFAGAQYLSGGKTGTAQAVTIGKSEKYNASRLKSTNATTLCTSLSRRRKIPKLRWRWWLKMRVLVLTVLPPSHAVFSITCC